MNDTLQLHTPAGRGRLAPPRARVGLIIPAVNTMSEPQFAHYCPSTLAIHATRLRISGKWKQSFAAMRGQVLEAAAMLADTGADLIVFHCTGTSMQEGAEGEAFVLDLIRSAAGVEAVTTGGAVVEALNTLDIKRPVLISPYVQATNDREIAYLKDRGIQVSHDVAVAIGGGALYPTISPRRWFELALENAPPDADGYFLSCTNTTQIEAIAAIEETTGKPVVSSNQAAIWLCLDRLAGKLDPADRPPPIGRLMSMKSTIGAVGS